MYCFFLGKNENFPKVGANFTMFFGVSYLFFLEIQYYFFFPKSTFVYLSNIFWHFGWTSQNYPKEPIWPYLGPLCSPNIAEGKIFEIPTVFFFQHPQFWVFCKKKTMISYLLFQFRSVFFFWFWQNIIFRAILGVLTLFASFSKSVCKSAGFFLSPDYFFDMVALVLGTKLVCTV